MDRNQNEPDPIAQRLNAPSWDPLGFYTNMDVPKCATETEIRRSYRRRVLKVHPDKNPDLEGADELMKHLNTARDVLLDEKKRKVYDETGKLQIDENSNPLNPWEAHFIMGVALGSCTCAFILATVPVGGVGALAAVHTAAALGGSKLTRANPAMTLGWITAPLVIAGTVTVVAAGGVGFILDSCTRKVRAVQYYMLPGARCTRLQNQSKPNDVQAGTNADNGVETTRSYYYLCVDCGSTVCIPCAYRCHRTHTLSALAWSDQFRCGCDMCVYQDISGQIRAKPVEDGWLLLDNPKTADDLLLGSIGAADDSSSSSCQCSSTPARGLYPQITMDQPVNVEPIDEHDWYQYDGERVGTDDHEPKKDTPVAAEGEGWEFV
eukprot:TRINITY_DN67248_c6_g11_i1.p1 TRINITY_DN67248_c6_g11~~TRINITY_DN67248_c6_g11_i1.p1  ORF type:complete len:388 (+),score=20.93 TRINITY_DN67248_c6_g11_i1:31-1164(+)